MITTSKLRVSFGSQVLFDDVNIKFLEGNCYGLIGANGAGKSTFLKVLSGDIEASQGDIIVPKDKRIAVLKQDQFAFDECKVFDTVLMGYPAFYDVFSERQTLYAKEDLTDDEGMRVSDLEVEFVDMDGYVAEADAATMLHELGIDESKHQLQMSSLEADEKIRVLLAQALFGNPDILLLDEPTNQLDYSTVLWLENFLLEFENTVIVVSHDRHFLNKVCTHTADIDYKQIKVFVGNYDFWKESTQLLMKQKQEHHKKATEKIKELEEFVRRFSANASKSKQATSRKKLIEKIRPEELEASSRRFPYINFNVDRHCGRSILEIKDVSHSIDGLPILKNVNLSMNQNDKVAICGKNSLSKTTLLQIIAGEIEPDEGEIVWGETVSSSYFPKDNSTYFQDNGPLLEWLAQFTSTHDTQELRNFLGRMLFSGDSVQKKVGVLSGGEKARAMFSRMMLKNANVLLFDEPTDHLDLEAISSLNDGLAKFSDCLLMTSHDFQLLNTVCNRVLEVSPLGSIDRMMSFSEYMEDSKIESLREELYAKATA